MDPSFLLALEKISNLKTVFYGKYDQHGKPLVGIPTWGNWIAGDRQANKIQKLDEIIDLGRPTIILPSQNEIKTNVRFKTNYLVYPDGIENAKKINNKTMAFFKDSPSGGISSRFKRDLRRYWKHFFDNKGTIKNIQEIDYKETARIYIKLHTARWKKSPKASKDLEMVMKELKPFLFGSVLYMDEEPVSIQIIYRVDNTKYSYFEYINSGVDMSKSSNKINLGNLLIDLNTREAEKISTNLGTELVYSFGLFSDPYKERWCKHIDTYKLGLI